ncbi:MAG TPA: aminotransferase class I/II-fold pyridoxal phosphate-dependent enzyme [Clostridiaceae bacterium]|nr:aminotransferase class I/II-fold pyridoxal phosphate-dependent enzyme [Clostridiaceae bacterium]
MEMENWNVPLYRAVRQYSSSNPIPFHMPGHKLGRGIPGEFLENLEMLDVTEINGTDNLHHPEGAIKEAQLLAAEAFGADKTYFLVNGSSCGIMASILTLCKPGDKIIVGRDCHKSVINGIILAGAHPVYVKPEFDNNFGISTVTAPSAIEEALGRHPDAMGVLITRPNYYGICSDIEEVAGIVHHKGKVLVVDEAHGAHLNFSDKLPESSIKLGADVCIQSAHKTLPAFTQGAYLHVRSSDVDLEKLEFNLRILQTTSPSYIIMVMLDMAREIMAKSGERLIDNLLHEIRAFREQVGRLENIEMLSKDNITGGEYDETRIVLNFKKAGITGFDVDRILRNEYNVQIEMADFYNALCIATVADRKEDFERLYCAVSEIAARFAGNPPLPDNIIKEFETAPLVMNPKEAVLNKGEAVPLDRAVGRICRSIVTPYPPGIPVVCPGEIVTENVVERIYIILKAGGKVNGLESNEEICVVS